MYIPTKAQRTQIFLVNLVSLWETFTGYSFFIPNSSIFTVIPLFRQIREYNRLCLSHKIPTFRTK